MTAQTSRSPALMIVAYYAVMLSLAGYFTYAAVQGDYGLFSRIEIEAQSAALEDRRAQLSAEVTRLENLTSRLSDDNLDLDLLDERVRAVLGKLRMDEIVIR